MKQAQMNTLRDRAARALLNVVCRDPELSEILWREQQTPVQLVYMQADAVLTEVEESIRHDERERLFAELKEYMTDPTHGQPVLAAVWAKNLIHGFTRRETDDADAK